VELDDEPLIKILATSDELIAVEDAIVHYLEYVKDGSETTKEEKGTVMLLMRLRQRLAQCTEEDEDVRAEEMDVRGPASAFAALSALPTFPILPPLPSNGRVFEEEEE
jgi:hypothetical protein